MAKAKITVVKKLDAHEVFGDTPPAPIPTHRCVDDLKWARNLTVKADALPTSVTGHLLTSSETSLAS